MDKVLEANYKGKCEVCDQAPTVVLMEGDSNLCGVCFFGTAEALDPETWVG